MLCIALTEFLNSPGSINELLFTGEKRMTGRADFDLEFRQDTAYFNFITAGTNRLDGLIFRMYIILHVYPTALQKALSLG